MLLEKNNVQLPIITKRTLMTNGDSLVIAIPTEWLKEKGLAKGDSVVLVANGNLTIHKDDPELRKKLSEAMGGLK